MHVRKLVCRQSHDDWDKMTKRLISHMICVYIEGKKWATHASMWFWAFRLKKKKVFLHSIKTKLNMVGHFNEIKKKLLRCKTLLRCFLLLLFLITLWSFIGKNMRRQLYFMALLLDHAGKLKLSLRSFE